MQETEKTQFYPWVGKIPWRRAWQPTPVFLFGESHGQRSLEVYSPWSLKEPDTADRLSTHAGRTKFGLGLMSPLVCLALCKSFFFFYMYTLLYFFIFGCTGSSLLCRLFSSCGKRGLLVHSVASLGCSGFSLQWLLLLWSTGSRHMGFSSCCTGARQLWLMGPRVCRLQ